jgi:hypothetical protein
VISFDKINLPFHYGVKKKGYCWCGGESPTRDLLLNLPWGAGQQLGLLLCFPQKEKKERVLLWVLTSLMRV